MCRYVHEMIYRTHFGCPPCRRSEKRWPWQRPACPDCTAPMVDLGRDFHAPRRQDVREWLKVELLVAAGIRFDSCGCTGPGPRPRTLADAYGELGLRRSGRRAPPG